MIKAIVMKSVMDNNSKIYEVGDYVRVKMKPSDLSRPQLHNEYIGRVIDIDFDSIVLLNDGFKNRLMLDNIEKMRYAKQDETFDNTIYF